MRNNLKFCCLNCGAEYYVNTDNIQKDKMGSYIECKNCGATSNVDEEEISIEIKWK